MLNTHELAYSIRVLVSPINNYVNKYLVIFNKIVNFLLFFSAVMVNVTSICKRIVYYGQVFQDIK